MLVNSNTTSFNALLEELLNYVKQNKKDYETEKKSLEKLFDGVPASIAEKRIKKLGLQNEILFLVKGLQEMAYVRTQTGAVLSHSTYLVKPLYRGIAVRLGTSYSKLKLLPPDDIIRLLKNNLKAPALIKTYQPLAVHIAARKKRYLFKGDDAKKINELMNSLIQDKKEPAGELSGNPANPGIVKGVVKIIMSSAKIDRVMKGDILVSPSTSIDFVPAMRKAAAIVTETGGITSHAAIVSRELNVPCVVGVRNATKLLKDLDLVIVDANVGRIRVLNSNKKIKP